MRSISMIARDIKQDWKDPYYGAVPYIDAMSSIGSINEKYGLDDASEIVLRFLSNAGAWRGQKAREVKAELKALLKSAKR